ncbi:MAG: hypothetical protein EXS00_08585 [Phycisphaerales bacterium]|nr:hypothetical protein [Phycisphaerales bacterium]
MYAAACCFALATQAVAQSAENPVSSAFGFSPSISRSLSGTQDASGMDFMLGVRPLLGARDEFAALQRSQVDALIGDPLAFAADAWFSMRQWAQDQGSTRLDLYDATVWQWATGTVPGDLSSGGVNRLNLRADTKLWNIDGQGMGRFTYQYRYTSTYPAGMGELGQNVGSNVSLDSDFTSFRNRLVRFRLEQALLDGHALLSAGKINPNDYILNNPYAGDEVTQFLASIFDGNDAMPAGFQGYMPGCALLIVPTEGLYCNLVATSPMGASSSGLGFDDLGDGLYWFGAEAGLVVSNAEGTRPGKYAVVVSNTNVGIGTTDSSTAVSGNSIGFLAAQEVGDNLGVFGEFVYANPDLSAVKWEWAAGVSIDRPFDRRGDGAGLAFGMEAPSDGTDRVESVVELYYRIQMTQTLQITPDIQFIVDPNNPANDQNFITVFGIRATLRF